MHPARGICRRDAAHGEGEQPGACERPLVSHDLGLPDLSAPVQFRVATFLASTRSSAASIETSS